MNLKISLLFGFVIGIVLGYMTILYIDIYIFKFIVVANLMK